VHRVGAVVGIGEDVVAELGAVAAGLSEEEEDGAPTPLPVPSLTVPETTSVPPVKVPASTLKKKRAESTPLATIFMFPVFAPAGTVTRTAPRSSSAITLVPATVGFVPSEKNTSTGAARFSTKKSMGSPTRP